MTPKSETGVSLEEWITATLECEHIFQSWTVLDPVLTPQQSVERRIRGGRPRKYPLGLLVLFDPLVDVHVSARGLFTHLKTDPGAWTRIRHTAAGHGIELPTKKPTRPWYVKTKCRLKPDQVEALRTAATAIGLQIAEETELLPADATRNTAHPRLECTVTCDGKVIHPPSAFVPGDTREVAVTDPDTGESRVATVPRKNVDPDARRHGEGGRSERVLGSKFWHSEVRGETPHSRVILQVAHVPDVKGQRNSEGDIMEREVIALARKAPGMQVLATDGVTRDKQRTSIIRSTGIKVISPPIAYSVDPKTGDREEKGRYIRTETFDYEDGTSQEVEVWAKGCALCVAFWNEDGERTFHPLKRSGNRTSENANGTWNDYVEYALPDPRTGRIRTIRESTTTSAADERAGFKRGEYIHQIPPTDPDYAPIKGRRSDSESANRQIDDHLPLARARSYGAQGVLFDLVGHQLAVGALALYRHRRRQAELTAA